MIEININFPAIAWPHCFSQNKFINQTIASNKLVKVFVLCTLEIFNSLHTGFLSSGDFFTNVFQEYHQNVKQSGLIWVQTVCQGYQQTTLVDKELNCSFVIHLPKCASFYLIKLHV